MLPRPLMQLDIAPQQERMCEQNVAWWRHIGTQSRELGWTTPWREAHSHHLSRVFLV